MNKKLISQSAIYNESYILLAGQKHPHLMVKKIRVQYRYRIQLKKISGPKLQDSMG
jgi:hypothetical protein